MPEETINLRLFEPSSDKYITYSLFCFVLQSSQSEFLSGLIGVHLSNERSGVLMFGKN